MGLIDQIKKVSELVTMNGGGDGWGVSQNWTSPTGQQVTIVGLHVKHHMGFDADGNVVNSKTASVTFSEKAMIDAAYSIRVNSEVNLDKHKVSVKDSTGNIYNYMVKTWLPDETLGLITCILSAYE